MDTLETYQRSKEAFTKETGEEVFEYGFDQYCHIKMRAYTHEYKMWLEKKVEEYLQKELEKI